MSPTKGNNPGTALSEREGFAARLLAAIEQRGLTYEEAARLVQKHLPPGAHLSSVSLWQYAHGKAFPRRARYIEAISKAFALDLNSPTAMTLSGPGGTDSLTGSEGRQINLEDVGKGRVRLYINTIVSWSLATRILRLFTTKSDTAE